MYSTLKSRGNKCFHVVSTWNTRGVFVGYCPFSLKVIVVPSVKEPQKTLAVIGLRQISNEGLINPLMPGGNKKVAYIKTTAGLFKYVRPF